MVRHAERDDGYDPPLNDTGWVRAEMLADELEDAGITTIFCPDFIRNRQTAEPLLERIDAEVRVYSQAESGNTKQLANDFVNEVVAEHSGEVVLWIGNTGPEIEGVQSGNLQEIYARLGGTGAPPVLYTSLYTIVLHDDGPPSITEGHYFIPEQD
jgi:broad specificity phosphatase PhoE